MMPTQTIIKILAVSDQRLPHMLNAEFLRRTYQDVDILVSCGDSDPDYLNFIATILAVPLYYVRGNHDSHYTEDNPGGIDLHRRVEAYKGMLLVGLEGSVRYNKGTPQYSQTEMVFQILPLLPAMLFRRIFTGYGTDVLVTHSPPRFIHDREDNAHQGFRALRWLIRLTRPRYLIHGHIDIWDQRDRRETDYLGTRVININPSKILDIDLG